MGWNIPEENQIPATGQDFNSKLEELKLAYDHLKSEFSELKIAFQLVNKKLEEKVEETKDIKKLKTDLANLKEDYKNCMDAVQTETFARNKAETVAKVLKETLDTQNAMKDVDHVTEDNMATEDEGDWKQPKRKQKEKSTEKQASQHTCETCGLMSKATYKAYGIPC